MVDLVLATLSMYRIKWLKFKKERNYSFCSVSLVSMLPFFCVVVIWLLSNMPPILSKSTNKCNHHYHPYSRIEAAPKGVSEEDLVEVIIAEATKNA